MSHSFCSKCNKAISCAKEICTKYILKATGKADAAGFIGLCDNCFEALPAGTPSEYIEGLNKELGVIQDSLDDVTEELRDLSELRKELIARKKAFTEDLFQYQPPEES